MLVSTNMVNPQETRSDPKSRELENVGLRMVPQGKDAKSGISTVNCVHAIQSDFLPLTNLTKLLTMYRNMMQTE